MALVLKDRVQETTTTTGTGTLTLLGAVTGYQSFAVIGNTNTTYYTISSTSSEWEVGIGTYTASGTTLSRDTILSSSNAGAAVNLSAGTKNVFCTYPSSRSIYADGTTLTATNSSVLPVASGGTGATTLTLNNVVLGNGTSAPQFVAPGTNGNILTSNGTTWTSAASAGAGAADVQTFTSTGTWTKPSGKSMAKIQLWGGGGGGTGNGGGGGGAYNEVTVPISYLAATVTATVGGFGAAGGTNGSPGGTSSFALATAVNGRSTISAYGGGGGNSSGGTGGGGGTLGTGGNGTGGGQGAGGLGGSIGFDQGGAGGQPTSSNGEFRFWGGGGGGTNTDNCNAGGSTFGGGGGSGYSTPGYNTSLYGGAGGVNAAGAAPGGGGGTGNAGGAGRIIVTSW